MVALLENIFNKVIFNNNNSFFVNSQQPPHEKINTACDITIQYVEKDTFQSRILCFVECKRTKTNAPFSLTKLENQALRCYKAHVSATKVSIIYAATGLGAHIRLWKYSERNENLTPYWGSETTGSWDEEERLKGDTSTIRSAS
jgi:hypothetical protein